MNAGTYIMFDRVFLGAQESLNRKRGAWNHEDAKIPSTQHSNESDNTLTARPSKAK